ncbi:hypothetical protein [Amycolatopsis thermophila]|uniref:Uncharacterized protein n=1 Tax=Amycolatopsis thermophila TaxID=206084 RepID=A0ABU0EYF4_9PSEU|nr:hypothetical protein [Amycolatopsis thermophila]MDQ0380293.1 hypothetical protein [Amycolatopsis thermophila]
MSAEEDDYDYVMARSFAERWAYGALRQAERLRDSLGRATVDERASQGLPPESVTKRLDAAWVEQHLLLVSTQQFEKWATRMLKARGEIRDKESDLLRFLRNSLEHLDEAVLDGGYAVPGDSGNWSLRQLPEGRLPLGIEIVDGQAKVLDLLDLDEIQRNCEELADEIFEEMASPYIDDMIDARMEELRGL